MTYRQIARQLGAPLREVERDAAHALVKMRLLMEAAGLDKAYARSAGAERERRPAPHRALLSAIVEGERRHAAPEPEARPRKRTAQKAQ